MKDNIFRHSLASGQRNQRGATVILVAILMIVFIGLAALAVDVSSLFVVRNELQNAADAGALAGARILYQDGGINMNPGARQEAYDAATENVAMTESGAVPVDINWIPGSNSGDIQIGHWSFATRTFTAAGDISVLIPTTGPTAGLINNAVRAVARRQDAPAASFFARIFGYEDFALAADAVAFVGTFRPTVFEQPIAICRQSITNPDGTLNCNTGRMTNSGANADTHNTAAWTNFTRPCSTANSPSVLPLICAEGNEEELPLGGGIGSTGGQVANVARDLRDCWRGQPELAKDAWGYPRERWSLTLPIIDCPSNNPGNCSTVLGAVNLDVLWINGGGADPQWVEVPVQMEDWECSHWVAAGRPTPANRSNLLDPSTRQQCWQEFATHFNLLTAGDTSVGALSPSELRAAMYFLPDCEGALQGPGGISEILKKPVLVNVPQKAP